MFIISENDMNIRHAIVGMALALTACCSLIAQNLQIPYQGFIADKSGKGYSGTFSFEFSILGGPTSWSSGTVNLPAASGLYSVTLGGTGQPPILPTMFLGTESLTLRIAFDDGVNGKQTLAPDVRLLPVPYAVRARYADTSFVQTTLGAMDSLVLRDRRGVVRMVMNPNTGTFSMRNNDTTWYSISVNSPPSEKFRYGDVTAEVKPETDGSTTVNFTDNKTGKTIETSNTRIDPKDNSVVQDTKKYDKDGNVTSETTETVKRDGSETSKQTNYGENGKPTYEASDETKDGVRTSQWKTYDEDGNPEESGELTSKNGEVTDSKTYDKDGNKTKETTTENGVRTETHYKNGKPTRQYRTEETADGHVHTQTTYDADGQPESSRTTRNTNGRWEYENKDLKGGKSSSNEPGKSTEKSGNSQSTVEPQKIDLKYNQEGFEISRNQTGGFIRINGGASGTEKKSEVFFDGLTGGISTTGPAFEVVSEEIVFKDDDKVARFEWDLGEDAPEFRMYTGMVTDKQITTLGGNGSSRVQLRVTDEQTDRSAGFTFEPLTEEIVTIGGLTATQAITVDTVKPLSRATVAFPNGISSLGLSVFHGGVDVGGAAQIQPNGTFTGAAVTAPNITAQQQLRANQLVPISPSNTVTINGNLNVVGNLTKGGGNFKIDHPLDPYNKYLIHSFVESPERSNIYSGNVLTNAEGIGMVTLPPYFEAANTDFRYQLTVVGTDARAYVAEEISNNVFAVKTDKPNVKVSWQITSTRTDSFARRNGYNPEQEKEPEMKGRLLYPEHGGLE